MVDVVIWKNLKIKYFKKFFKVLKDKVNKEFSYSFSSNYRTMKPSCTVPVISILSDMLQFNVVFTSKDFKGEGRTCVCIYIYIYTSLF